MAKTVIVILLTLALLIISACSNDGEGANQDAVSAASLGGISLGDSAEIVTSILGQNYTESIEADYAGIIGEDMAVWNYENGIVIYIGKTSGKVLKVTAIDPGFQTDLGIKAGDKAKKIFQVYKPIFEEAVSRHSDETLAGWFLMGDGSVMIFDFDASDGAVVNSSITPDSCVEEIILADWKHFN